MFCKECGSEMNLLDVEQTGGLYGIDCIGTYTCDVCGNAESRYWIEHYEDNEHRDEEEE